MATSKKEIEEAMRAALIELGSAGQKGACYITVSNSTSCASDMTERACRAAAEELSGTYRFEPGQDCH